jgi:hypothetical protein
MSSRIQTAGCVVGNLCGAVCLARSYRRDLIVVDIAGESIAGVFGCGATAGQDAAGLTTGRGYAPAASDQSLTRT